MCYPVQIAKLNQQIALRIYALLDFWILIVPDISNHCPCLNFSAFNTSSSLFL